MVDEIIYEAYVDKDKTGIIIQANNEDEAYKKLKQMGIKKRNVELVEIEY